MTNTVAVVYTAVFAAKAPFNQSFLTVAIVTAAGNTFSALEAATVIGIEGVSWGAVNGDRPGRPAAAHSREATGTIVRATLK